VRSVLPGLSALLAATGVLMFRWAQAKPAALHNYLCRDAMHALLAATGVLGREQVR